MQTRPKYPIKRTGSRESGVRPRRKVLGLVAAGAVLAIAAGACSSASSNRASAPDTKAPVSSGTTASAPASGSANASAGGGDAVANAKQIVDKYLQSPSGWEGPSDSPPPKKGARIAIISANQATEGTAIVAKDMQAAAQVLGWKVTIFDGQGDQSVQLKALNSAIDSKYDGIVLDIIDTRVVQEGVQRAVSAGIPLITLGDLVNEPASVPDVSHDWVHAGQLAAYYMIANSPDGKVDVLVLADFEFPAVKIGEYKGIMSVLKDKTQCPNCKVTEKQFLSKNIETQPGSLAIAQIQQDPNTNWVWCYDACMQRVATQVIASGVKTQAHGVGMNGNPPNLQLIQGGKFQVAAIANPYPFESWATMDNLNRVLNKQPAYDWPKALPLRIIDKSNVGSLAETDRTIGWTGEIDYESNFKKLWGVAG
jgi:ribose transport system substrate-binding protein